MAPIHLVATREGPLDRWRGGPWGMNNPAAYTPLESLFLFQSLLAHGIDNGAFGRISELLKGNALIKSGETYDPARLSPDALQQLFLLLLRDELWSEAERVDGGDGSGSPGSRKRKLGSPPMPTLKDVYENVDKIPILVDRLYARYRDHMVILVREDERRFATVQKEIQLLERSEKERLARAASQNGTPILAPRDPKSLTGGNGSIHSPGPLQGLAPGIRRGLAPNSPLLPQKPPTPVITAPAGASPSLLRSSTPTVRPSPSPKPLNGTAPVLQAPAGVPGTPTPAAPTPPRVLQAPAQVSTQLPTQALVPALATAQAPKPAISPRLDAVAVNVKDPPPTGPAQAATPPAGTLKWEKPYQPPQFAQAPLAGQQQQLPVVPPSANQLKLQQQQWQQQQQQLQQQLHQQRQQAQHPNQTAGPVPYQQHQARPPPSKPALIPPQPSGQLVPPLQPSTPLPTQVRTPTSTSAIPPGRPIQPNQPQSQQAQQLQQAQHTPRPIAAAAPAPGKATPGSIVPQRWPQSIPQQQARRPSPSASPAPLASLKEKSYSSPYVAQPPRPAIPEHMIRQAASTPGPLRRLSPASPAPRTPTPSSPVSLKRGFGTKWASQSTPSTPGPIDSEPESPAYEPVSPPPQSTTIKRSVSKSKPTLQLPKPISKGDITPVAKTGHSRTPRTAQRSRGVSATPSATGTRRSQSVTSQTDELSIDHTLTATKVKKEVGTPRLLEETGDTTADESVHGRGHMVTPSSISSRVHKRKRQATPEILGPPTHVLWTRGFTKVSSSALDQISSHRDANMFATALRERDAPNYRQIVLQPQDITSIRAGIKAGNKAAVQAAANLVGGDPGTASVWLPISEDLVPPKGIINSAHLERELVHMFCNAIMYNPDPNRGPGPAFMKRSQDDEEEVVGYRLDENGVVKNAQCMFLEVEKLLGDLRSAEKERAIPPTLSATRQGSVVTPADDTAEDEDELAGDGDTPSGTGTVKRRRISTRG